MLSGNQPVVGADTLARYATGFSRGGEIRATRVANQEPTGDSGSTDCGNPQYEQRSPRSSADLLILSPSPADDNRHATSQYPSTTRASLRRTMRAPAIEKSLESRPLSDRRFHR